MAGGSGSGSKWVAELKKTLGDSPVVSNVAVSFVMLGLERVADMHFECPCYPVASQMMSYFFMFLPAVMVFILMLMIQDFKECRNQPCKHSCATCCTALVPSCVWLFLVLLDGRYFACALSYWHGICEGMEKAEPLKWCDPNGRTIWDDRNVTISEKDLQEATHKFYYISQVSSTSSHSLTL